MVSKAFLRHLHLQITARGGKSLQGRICRLHVCNLFIYASSHLNAACYHRQGPHGITANRATSGPCHPSPAWEHGSCDVILLTLIDVLPEIQEPEISNARNLRTLEHCSHAEQHCVSAPDMLQATWYYVQQPLASLGLLAGLAGQASREGLRGAPLLDLLQAKAASVAGNPAAR